MTQSIQAKARESDRLPLGIMLRQLRLSKGLSQRDLAEGICFRTYVSEIEQGDRFPTPTVLADLAARLEVPLEQLVESYLGAPMAGIGQRLSLARKLADQGALDTAQLVLDESVKLLAAEPRPQAYAADFKETVGIISYKSGRIAQALEALEEALHLRRKSRSRPYPLARAYLRVGLVAMEAGQSDSAEQALWDAYHAVLWLNPAEVPESRKKVTDLHLRIVQALGYLLLVTRNLQGALHVYRFAAQRWHAYGISAADSPDIVLGQALAEMGTGHFDAARRTLTQLLEHPGSHAIAVRVHTNLGVLDRLFGNWPGAARHQERAWALFQESGEGDPRSICNEFARCALHVADWSAAAAWLERSGAQSAPAGDGAGVAETHLLESKLARGQGHIETAKERLALGTALPGLPQPLRQALLIEQLRLDLAASDPHGLLNTVRSLEAELGLTVL